MILKSYAVQPKNNVISISIWRPDEAPTLVWHCFDVMYLLGMATRHHSNAVADPEGVQGAQSNSPLHPLPQNVLVRFRIFTCRSVLTFVLGDQRVSACVLLVVVNTCHNHTSYFLHHEMILCFLLWALFFYQQYWSKIFNSLSQKKDSSRAQQLATLQILTKVLIGYQVAKLSCFCITVKYRLRMTCTYAQSHQSSPCMYTKCKQVVFRRDLKAMCLLSKYLKAWI